MTQLGMQPIHEYRYGSAARQRAVLLLMLACFALVSLVALFVSRWSEFGLPTQTLGVVLLVFVLFTVRAQLTRILFRCQIYPHMLAMRTLLGMRKIGWERIVEVRRLWLPQLSGRTRWACTVYTLSRRGTPVPAYLFDDQLEHADAALQDVVARTPHAQHTNI